MLKTKGALRVQSQELVKGKEAAIVPHWNHGVFVLGASRVVKVLNHMSVEKPTNYKISSHLSASFHSCTLRTASS